MNKRTNLTASIRNLVASHPRLVTMGIYAGVALAISAAMGFALDSDVQQLRVAQQIG